MQTLRLFISSPGDVESERLRTQRLIGRLAHDYSHWAELLPYFWEHEPHDPAADFTTSIGSTADYDIVVVILWSRLGHRLHSRHRRPDGEPFRSGTEYEVLTALEARERSAERLPRLAVFLNRTEVSLPLSLQKEKREEIQRQYDALQAFLSEHFQERESDPEWGEILTNKRAYTAYRTLDEFEDLLEKALRGAIEGVLGIESALPFGANLASRPEPTWEGNPYRALEVFEATHAPIYFGRTRAIGQVVDRLRARFGSGQSFVMILGASGSGKSSLLRAGVVPLATSPGVIPGVGRWRQAILKPSDGAGDPFLALAAALLRPEAVPELIEAGPDGEAGGAHGRAQHDLAVRLRQGPAAAAARIEATLAGVARVERELQAAELRRLATEFDRSGRGEDAAAARDRAAALPLPGVGLLLAVDQMEELFTGTVTEESRRTFLDTIQSLAGSPAVLVLATLRSDFYPECEGHAGLMELKEGPGSYHLEPPSRAELERMIREPARAAGVFFEEHPDRGRLDAAILEAAERDPDSLPLLEFCLSRLFEVGHADGVLTFAQYETIGELGGVLSQRAEEVFSSLAAHERGSLEEVIRALATLSTEDSSRPASVGRPGATGGMDETGEAPAVVRRVVPVAVFDRLPGARGLVDRFVAERLLTSGLDAHGVPVVSVTHEALLKQWKRVSAWLGLDENRRFLAVRARVAQRLRQWEESGRDASFLLHAGRELEEAEREFADYPLAFAEGEKGLLLASRAQVRQQERRRAKARRAVLVALSGLTLAALGAAGWAMKKQREAVIERQRTQVQLERSQLEEGRAWLERAKLAWEWEKDPLKALMFAGRAVGFHGYGRRENEAPEVAERYPSLLGKPMVDPVNEVERRREEMAVRSYAENVVFPALPIWSSPVWRHHQGPVTSVAFSPDGSRLASGSHDETIKLWDTTSGKQLATLQGHSGAVTSVAFSHDGSRLASGSCDRTVKVWDAASGRELTTLQGHAREVESVAFSPDGSRLASRDWGATMKLWDTASGTEVATPYGHTEHATSLAFSPDGSRLALAEGGAIGIWEVPSGTELATLPGDSFAVYSLAFSPDGSHLASGSYDNTIKLWDAATGKKLATFEGHSEQINNVAFSPDGMRLASESTDKTIKIWDVASGQELATLRGNYDYLRGVAFSSDGSRVASGADDSIVFWDAATGKEIIRQGHSKKISSMAFSPNGSRLASASTDRTIKLWDVASGTELATLKGHSGAVTSVAFSPDGSRLASGAEDITIRLWDADSGEELAKLLGGCSGVNSVAFSPDGSHLALGSRDGNIKLWEATSGKELATLEGHTDRITSVAFSPDGSRLASGSYDETIKLWDTTSGKQLATLNGHSDFVTSVAFSPDGSRLASGANDRTIKLWDTASGKGLAEFTGPADTLSSVVFSPDGIRLASVWGAAIKILDGNTGKELTTCQGHSWEIRTVAFSPDGRRIASGSRDNSIRLWEVASGKELATLQMHSNEVFTVAFSPDGSRLVSGSGDGTIKFWGAASGMELKTLQGHSVGVANLGYSKDGSLLASGGYDNTIKLWDTAIGIELATLKGHSNTVHSVAFSQDGKRLASGSDDKTVKLWDNASGKEIAILEGHSEGVTCVAFSPDGRRLASGSGDTTIKLWDAVNGKELVTLEGHSKAVLSVVFSIDGGRLASGSGDTTIKLWDAVNGEELETLEGHSNWVKSVAFSPDGSRLASGSEDASIKLWDSAGGRELNTLQGHSGAVTSLAFSHDGSRLASGSSDRTIKLWDVANGKELDTLEGHSKYVTSVAYSPDGSCIASGSLDKTIKLWVGAMGTKLSGYTDFAPHLDRSKASLGGKMQANINGEAKLLRSDQGYRDLLAYERAGYVSLQDREVVWNTTSDLLFESRTFPPIPPRRDLLAQLGADDLLPARRLMLRLQLSTRSAAWRTLPGLWREAQDAGLETGPDVRRTFLRSVAMAVRTMGNADKPAFPTDLWSLLAAKLTSADFQDSIFSLSLAQALPPFIKEETAEQALVTSLSNQIISAAPPLWLEAVASSLSEADKNESGVVTARRHAFLSEVRAKYPDLAPKPNPDSDPTRSDR